MPRGRFQSQDCLRMIHSEGVSFFWVLYVIGIYLVVKKRVIGVTMMSKIPTLQAHSSTHLTKEPSPNTICKSIHLDIISTLLFPSPPLK